jgi:hypothetical protein
MLALRSSARCPAVAGQRSEASARVRGPCCPAAIRGVDGPADPAASASSIASSLVAGVASVLIAASCIAGPSYAAVAEEPRPHLGVGSEAFVEAQEARFDGYLNTAELRDFLDMTMKGGFKQPELEKGRLKVRRPCLGTGVWGSAGRCGRWGALWLK